MPALRVQIPQVKEDASTPASKPAKVQAESAQPSPWVEEDAPLEPKFPTDWIRNDVKFNADVDTMEQREKSIQERVKKQQAWKATREAWIQTKVFYENQLRPNISPERNRVGRFNRA